MTTRIITIAGFALMLAALVALQLLGRRPDSRIPTLSQWLGYLMRSRAGRGPSHAGLAMAGLALLRPLTGG